MCRSVYLILMLGLVGCVSQSNLFQDGKTRGKGEWDGALSLSMNYTAQFTYDSSRKAFNIKPYHFAMPWAQVQGQYGVGKRIDLGGSFGIGVFSVGANVLAKIALLRNESAIGAALFTSAGFAASDNEKVEGDQIRNFYYLVALPISFDLSEKDQIVFQPIYRKELFTASSNSNRGVGKSKITTSYLTIGVGLIHTYEKLDRLKVHYNLGLNYFRDENRTWPSFGLAFSKPK